MEKRAPSSVQYEWRKSSLVASMDFRMLTFASIADTVIHAVVCAQWFRLRRLSEQHSLQPVE